MRVNRVAMAGAFLLFGASIAGWQHMEHVRAVREKAEIIAQTKLIVQESEALEDSLAVLRDRIAQEQQHWQKTADEVAGLAVEVAKSAPESRWAAPPDDLPQWNSESPYVWLRKEILPRLPVDVFTRDGRIEAAAAEVLTVPPSVAAQLNRQLEKRLAAYREQELKHVERTDQHPPGFATKPGKKLTIRVSASGDEAKRARDEFEAILRQHLGQQRADLVVQVSGSWLGEQFPESPEGKTISLVQESDGGISIGVQSPSSYFMTGLPRDYAFRITEYLPPHLLSCFKEVLEQESKPEAARP